MAIDCTDPNVLRSAYGGAVCKSEALGVSQTENARRLAEMQAAGWTGGGWNVYQSALAERSARKGVPVAPAPAPFPFVQLGLGAAAVGGLIWWWRS